MTSFSNFIQEVFVVLFQFKSNIYSMNNNSIKLYFNEKCLLNEKESISYLNYFFILKLL